MFFLRKTSLSHAVMAILPRIYGYKIQIFLDGFVVMKVSKSVCFMHRLRQSCGWIFQHISSAIILPRSIQKYLKVLRSIKYKYKVFYASASVSLAAGFCLLLWQDRELNQQAGDWLGVKGFKSWKKNLKIVRVQNYPDIIIQNIFGRFYICLLSKKYF